MAKSFFILFELLFFIGCTAKIDQTQVKASNDIPEAAKVEEVNVSYNASKPLFYMTVEPIVVREVVGESNIDVGNDYNKEKTKSKKNENEKKSSSTKIQQHETNTLNVNLKLYRNYFLARQRQITNQLNSSLAGIKNFKLLDYEMNKKGNFVFAKSNSTDRGPYLVRAVITECNDQVKYQKDKSTIPLFYTTKDLEIIKMIGLDIQVIDPKTGEIVEAFPVQGSYTYRDASVDGGFIADFSTSKITVQSSIDQALRVALNDAAKKLSDRLLVKE